MSTEEAHKYYEALKKDFNDPDVLSDAINLSSFDSLMISEIDKIPELKHFYGFDHEGPYSEFLKRGLKSLRPGFYKIHEQPFYNTRILPKTFSAKVYYYHPYFSNGNLILYEANIGPMTNTHAIYNPIIGTKKSEEIQLLNTFHREKYSIGTSDDHYLVPKGNFYNKIFNDGEIFFVAESIFDPSFPNANPRPVKVTWSFINY